MTPRLALAFKAARELGLPALRDYASYQLGLHSGALRRRTPAGDAFPWPGGAAGEFQPFLTLQQPRVLSGALGAAGASDLRREAEEIAAGKSRLFGGPAVRLELAPPGPLRHWTAYRGEPAASPERDIKWTWEPARCGWIFVLARAYHLDRDERCAAALWQQLETFLDANPANLGPNWISAQEVAMRLMAFSFALQVFAASPHTTPERRRRLVQAAAAHARRIPPSLAYARAQKNNHLLVEAAGLWTASVLLPGHPQAQEWGRLGRRWFNHAVLTQFAPDGAYIQHSVNYHRLALQAALWVRRLAASQGETLDEAVQQALAAGTRWLLKLVDRGSGCPPNLGPNDGANLLPLAACPFSDYRPALQAAAQAFLGERPFPLGPWDEPLLWLGEAGWEKSIYTNAQIAQDMKKRDNQAAAGSMAAELRDTPHVLRSRRSWAYLRAARFASRPGHADQLHLDLWWRGLNVAQDAGTYLYNAPPPWDNALVHTTFHNTLSVDGRDQMTPAGRFLFLDWAQARVILRDRTGDGSAENLLARHDGYRGLHLVHQRQVSVLHPDRWVVQDWLLPTEAGSRQPPPMVSARLHWLLPDWKWELQAPGGNAFMLRIKSPYGWITLTIASPRSLECSLARAGELVYAPQPVPVEAARGWAAPTYGHKVPALSAAASLHLGSPPGGDLFLESTWEFPRHVCRE